MLASDSPISAATRARMPFSLLIKQPDAAVEAAVQLAAPLDRDPAVRLLGAQALGLRAVGRVHDQALVAAQLADDVVARDRQAARRQLHRHAFAAVDRDRIELAARCSAAVGTLVDVAAHAGRRCGAPPAPACACRCRCRRTARPSTWPRIRPAGARSVASRSSARDAQLAERLRQQFLAQLDRFVQVDGAQVVADRRARLAGADETQPGRARARVRVGLDLDDVAVVQLGAQRRRLVVDLDRHRVVADAGVDAVGEVERRWRRAAGR